MNKEAQVFMVIFMMMIIFGAYMMMSGGDEEGGGYGNLDGGGINNDGGAVSGDATYNVSTENVDVGGGGSNGANGLVCGDIVKLKAQASAYPGHDGYLSPCGGEIGGCGRDVTLRPDSDFQGYEPNSGLRDWKVECPNGSDGDSVVYGDTVKLKSQPDPTRFSDHVGYLSPCGSGIVGCGAGVTLRYDANFQGYEPNSGLRDWEFEGGSGQVGFGTNVKIKSKPNPTRFSDHAGYLSPCQSKDGCGVDVTLRPDSIYTPGQNLRHWQIERV